MRFFFLLSLLTFSIVAPLIDLCEQPVLSLVEGGEIVNKELPYINYAQTYTYFDYFIDSVLGDVLAQEELLEVMDRLYKDDDIVVRYRSIILDPTDPFEYYEYRKEEFFLLFTDETGKLFKECSFYEGKSGKFIDLLFAINKKAETVFKEQIEEMEGRYPGIKELLYGANGQLTIATKVTRYNKNTSMDRPTSYNIIGTSIVWNERLMLLWDGGNYNYHNSNNYSYHLISYALIDGHIPSTVEFPKKRALALQE